LNSSELPIFPTIKHYVSETQAIVAIAAAMFAASTAASPAELAKRVFTTPEDSRMP
jgi:hypothetical protein